ncbi:MAG TPA: oxalurate catabolism protein HpxZ [Hyphomicrobiaceae bacterium]|nr:oxalurate catabolism protein HpxZ [Hyphomicrobiaceae bacterium]
MQINLPDVVAEVSALFERYEKALTTNDIETLTALFRKAPETIRYGIGENLYGAEEILAFRQARPAVNLERTIDRTVITAYGRDCATASTLFHREAMGDRKIGRQMQTWIRFPDGWFIVAAHVSIIEKPA